MNPTGTDASPTQPPALLRVHQHLALAAFWFGTNFHWGALTPILLPSLMRQLDGRLSLFGRELSPESALGVLLAIGVVPAAVLPPIVGAFSDRNRSPLGRRRPYIFWGTLINLLGLWGVVTAFGASSFIGLVGAFLVIQAGNNIAVGAYTGLMPDVASAEERGTASGYMAAMTQLGTIGGGLVTGTLIGQGKMGLALGVVAVCLLVFALATMVGVREQRLQHAQPFQWRNVSSLFWINPREHPDFAWVWITRALFTMGMWVIFPYLVYYLQDVVGLSEEVAAQRMGMLMALVLLGATPMGLFGGMLSDRWGRKKIVFAASALMAVTAVLFIAAGLGSTVEARYWSAVGIAVVFGLAYGAYYSVDFALGADVLPNLHDAGKDMGIWHLSMVLPQAVAPGIAGAVLDRFRVNGRPSEVGYAVAFGLAALFLALAAVLIFKVKKAR